MKDYECDRWLLTYGGGACCCCWLIITWSLCLCCRSRSSSFCFEKLKIKWTELLLVPCQCSELTRQWLVCNKLNKIKSNNVPGFQNFTMKGSLRGGLIRRSYIHAAYNISQGTSILGGLILENGEHGQFKSKCFVLIKAWIATVPCNQSYAAL